MHTLMDLRGSIPTFARLTDGRVHDSKIMDKIPVEPNAYYLMDKGYVKFDALYKHFHLKNAYFVTRAKDNMVYEILGRRKVDPDAGLISDQTIRLTAVKTSSKYSTPHLSDHRISFLSLVRFHCKPLSVPGTGSVKADL